MPRYEEERFVGEGFGGPTRETRVYDAPADEPGRGVPVSEDTPEHDWEPARAAVEETF